MNEPLVSILVPTYQHVAFIGAALDSALAQTYRHTEILVADDGSTDGTTEIIDSYVKKFSDRIRALPRRTNGGIDGVRDNSLQLFVEGRGKYFCILEGDDIYLPDKVERQVAWMEQDERRVLCAHAVEVFDSDTGARLFESGERFPLYAGRGASRLIRLQFQPMTVSIMIRASVLPPHFLEPRVRLIGDWLLKIECVGDHGEYGYVEGVLARYRVRPVSMMKSGSFSQVRLEDQMTVLALAQARFPDLGAACRDGRSKILFFAAMYHLRRGGVREARQLSRAALRERFGFRRLALAVLTQLPEFMSGACVRWYADRPAGIAWLLFR